MLIQIPVQQTTVSCSPAGRNYELQIHMLQKSLRKSRLNGMHQIFHVQGQTLSFSRQHICNSPNIWHDLGDVFHFI